MFTLRSVPTFFLLISLLSLAGCGQMTRQVARNATPAAVDSGVVAFTSDANQDALVDAIDEERIKEASTEIVGGTTDGVIAALQQESRQEQLSDAMAPLVASMVDASVEAALSDKNLARVRELAKEATLGFQDAIDEVEKKKREGQMSEDEGNVLAAVDRVAQKGDTAFYLLMAIAGLLGVSLIVGVIWAVRRRNVYEAEAKRRDEEMEEIKRQLLASRGANDAEAQSAPYNGGRLKASAHDSEARRDRLSQG